MQLNGKILEINKMSISSYLQLRYLQTLSSIAAEHNSTIIFPMPMNILDHFMGKKSKDKDKDFASIEGEDLY